MAIMNFQLVAILGQQRRPILALGNWRRLVERWARLLIRHLQEQQKRQLLHVIAIRQTIIAENVAIVPKLLDELGWITHEIESSRIVAPWPDVKAEGCCSDSKVLYPTETNHSCHLFITFAKQ